jgi:hypothetical protein
LVSPRASDMSDPLGTVVEVRAQRASKPRKGRLGLNHRQLAFAMIDSAYRSRFSIFFSSGSVSGPLM